MQLILFIKIFLIYFISLYTLLLLVYIHLLHSSVSKISPSSFNIYYSLWSLKSSVFDLSGIFALSFIFFKF